MFESPQWDDSNKYPKHMFHEEIRLKQGMSYVHVSFCSLLRARRNEKEIKVKPETSFKLLTIFIHKKTKQKKKKKTKKKKQKQKKKTTKKNKKKNKKKNTTTHDSKQKNVSKQYLSSLCHKVPQKKL